MSTCRGSALQEHKGNQSWGARRIDYVEPKLAQVHLQCHRRSISMQACEFCARTNAQTYLEHLRSNGHQLGTHLKHLHFLVDGRHVADQHVRVCGS